MANPSSPRPPQADSMSVVAPLRILCSCLSFAVVFLGVLRAESPSKPPVTISYERTEHGVILHLGELRKELSFFSEATVHVETDLGERYWGHPSLVVVGSPQTVRLAVEQRAGKLFLSSPRLTVEIDESSAALRFLQPGGALLLAEDARQPSEIRSLMISGAPTYEVSHHFEVQERESLYGLGQYNQPYMDYRGQQVLMVQTNIGIVVPFLISTQRYGILWDIASKMNFSEKGGHATLWAESAPGGLDYYFVASETMDGVLAGYRELTGAAPMYPRAAFGLFMSKERYKTQAQLLEVVRSFRRDGFPLDYIVQDWQYWGGDKDGTWSGMIWDKQRFPDPSAMSRTLHEELHVKLMNSIWPSVGDDTELARELDAKGLRFAPVHWISKHAHIYDAFSPEGRAIYFRHIKKGLLDVGVDALWMDGTEVEVGGACHDAGEVERDIKGLGRNALGDFTRYLNIYSLLTTRGTYEGQRATGDRRVLTLTRSAWAGQQRYAALPWSGDTTASWATLRQQIAGGLNVCMAGLPYWTQDTGGFFVNFPEGARSEEYRELYARWNQFAIFNPLYRIHGTQIDREPYLFKETAPELYDSLLKAARLRYRLLPYIYSLAWRTTTEGYILMRGMPLDFPDDLRVRKTDDSFMFGPAFLVHPVTRAMYHVSEPPPDTIPGQYLVNAEGRQGLDVQYFSGVDFDRPAGKTLDPVVDHSWPGPPLANPPPGLVSFDYFSARWEGFLISPEAGDYELGIEYDDGGRLYLDGRLVVDDWGFGSKRYRGAKVTLAKGQRVAVRADYHQGLYARSFRFTWKTPAQLRQAASKSMQVDSSLATYLPEAAAWYDFWSQRCYKGGQERVMNCPLNRFPVYVRAGSIVVQGPELQYATEKLEAPYEVRVYTGADTRFTVYEDDNESYRYEHGEYATYEICWQEATHRLLISPRRGSYPGMPPVRELRVVFVRGEPTQEGSPSSETVQTLLYTGQPVELHPFESNERLH